MLAAGLKGIEEGYPLPPEATDNIYALTDAERLAEGITALPGSLRDAVAGFQKLHATCEAYTSSIPYVVWRELLREMYEFGRETPDAVIEERIRAEVATKAPDLAPWVPLLAAVFDVEIAATPEVLELAETNRRTKMHETVARFLEAVVPDKLLVEIDDVHHMDKASAELLAHIARGLASRPWLFAIGRRPLSTGFEATESPEAVRIDLRSDRAAGCAAPGTARDRAEPASGACPRCRRETVRRQSAIPARLAAFGDRLRRNRGPARVRRSGHDYADRHARARRPGAGPPRRGVRPDISPADAGLALFRGGWPCARRCGTLPIARTVRRGARRVPALSPHAVARLGVRRAAVQAPATFTVRSQRVEEKWISRKRPRPHCHCTISKPANSNLRGAMRRQPRSARRQCMPSSKPLACMRAAGARSM